MKKIDVFDLFANHFTYAWKHNLLLGIAFIAFGFLIIFFPIILVALIASFFILSGTAFLHLAWRGRMFRKQYYDPIRIHIDDIF